MLGTRKGKLFEFLNREVRCQIGEQRHIQGTFVSFDRHMNMVLSKAKEVRSAEKIDKETGEAEVLSRSRALGLVFVRGDQVLSLIAEKPKKKKKPKKAKDAAAAAAGGAGAGAGVGDSATSLGKRKRDGGTLDEAELMAQRAAALQAGK